jgi:hypothetical protein
MAYDFSALNDELIQNTEWLWSFFYTLAYILLIASIIWFSKLKQMLEYKKFSESLKNEQEMGLDRNNSANDFAEEFEDLNETLGAMKNITEKAEEQLVFSNVIKSSVGAKQMTTSTSPTFSCLSILSS